MRGIYSHFGDIYIRFKTMAKALKCEYEIDIPEFSKVSAEARDLVQKLLLATPGDRLTAEECLAHPWLSGDVTYMNVLNELETTWMRRCLARRRSVLAGFQCGLSL